MLNFIGYLLKHTYKYRSDSFSNKKYIYFFFYQRILLFNFFIPWPVHFTSYITGLSNIKFGKNSCPGSAPNQYIQGQNGIEIGDDVWIAPGVQIISSNHDPDDYSKALASRPVKIGSHVWIGGNSIILPGIHIGDNVIIGAGSIVTKDVPDNCVAVGNPCRVIKTKAPYKGMRKFK